MGCFNITGFHSKLPIKYGDKCFLLIGLFNNKEIGKGLHFSPDSYFSPIALPIIGYYNDYGTIEKVEEDFNTKLIEGFTGMSVEKLIDLIDDTMIDRYRSDEEKEKFKNIFEKIHGLINTSYPHKKDYKLAIAIDHYFVYEEMLKQDNVFNFDESFRITKEVTLEHKFNEETQKRIDLFKKISDIPELKDIQFEYSTEWHFIIQSHFEKLNSSYYAPPIYCINPSIKCHTYLNYFTSGYLNGNFLLLLYQDENNSKLLFEDENVDKYKNFLIFIKAFSHIYGEIIPHSSSSQDAYSSLKASLPLYKKYVEHAEKVIEEYGAEYDDE